VTHLAFYTNDKSIDSFCDSAHIEKDESLVKGCQEALVRSILRWLGSLAGLCAIARQKKTPHSTSMGFFLI